VNLLASPFDPKWNFDRCYFATSFIGLADLCAIVPFYVQCVVLPLLATAGVVGAEGVALDATVFRVLRLARVLELERFFVAFS
jgi:hypothetical protein